MGIPRRAALAIALACALAGSAAAAYGAFSGTTSNGGNSLAAATTFSPYRDAILADSPAGYWRMGEGSGTSAADESGNGNGGVYTGGVTLGQSGGLLEDANTAASFDGTDDYVNVPDSASLDVGDTVTVEAWVKRASTGSDRSIVEKNGHFELYFAADDKLTLRKPGEGDVAESTRTITDASWHHVVGTKSGSTVRLYIDGVDVTAKVTNRTLVDNANALTIGRTPNFSGSIDEAAVYATALTAARVEAHYDAGRPYHGEVLSDAPKALWRLGESADRTQVAFDSKGTSHGLYFYDPGRGASDALLGSTNTATDFDGVNDGVEVASAVAPQLSGSFTIEAWVKPDAVGGSRFIVNRDTNYYLYLNGSDIVFGYRSGATYTYTLSAGAAQLAAWQHLAGTWDGTTLRLYRNGILLTSVASSLSVNASTGKLFLGALSATGGFFDGAVDEVALYDGALSAGRIQAHYESGRPYRKEVLADAPASYWRFAESGEGGIVHRSATSAARTTNGTTLAVNAPAGVGANDVLVAGVQESGGTTGTLTAPSGWTLIRTQTLVSGGGAATDTKLYTYYKVAGATEPASYTWTSSLSAEHSGGIVALTGVDTSSPIDASASQENAASLSVTCPAVTTTADAALLVAFPFTHDGTTFAFPASLTERFDVRTGTATTDRAIAGGTELLGAAGSTGTRTITNQNPGAFAAPTSACATIALTPAPEAAYDHQHANEGSYHGGVTLGAAGGLAGDSDRAIQLNGSTGYASVRDSASLDLGDGGFTLEAWVKRASSGDGTILSKGTNAYELGIVAGRLVLRQAGVGDIASSTATISDTTDWHHVVATKSGAAVKLYVDGADVTGTVTNRTLADTSAALEIGRGPSFSGSIDELALYRTVLSAARVQAHFATGKG